MVASSTAGSRGGTGGPRRHRPPGGERGGSGNGGSGRGGSTGSGSGRDASDRTARRAAQRERAQAPDVHDPDGVRLQKVLASAGVGSRRACEALISAGRVSVDGTVVRDLGVRVDPDRVSVELDSLPLQLDTSRIYLAINKPRGVLSTMHDPQGRPSLEGFVEGRRDRLFHVGRLDADSEGLMILTNDGDLAHRLQHPSFEIAKTYLAEVRVDGVTGVPKGIGTRLRAGVDLDDGVARADSFKLLDSVPGRAVVEVIVHEGRKHVVRRMLGAVDLPVDRLVRTQMGPVHLADLKPGKKRALNREELGLLRGRDPRPKDGSGKQRAARPGPDRRR